MKHIYVQENPEDKLREECGVFGAYDFGGGDVASTVYYGLLALQHRGQESCGIAVSDTEGPKGRIFSHKDMGLVNEAFAPEHLERLNSGSVEEAVGRTMGRLRGSYSLVVMSPRKLIGARDPYGFRPLCIGKRDQMYLLSSESCALDVVGAEFVRDVLPGEIVTISPEHGIQSDVSHMIPQERTGRCIFEYIYFARPDSVIDGISVYHSRILAGKFLANGRSTEEIRQIIGSDSLEYLGIERLEELVGGAGICKGCFTGNYPVEAPDTKNIYAV